MVSRGVAGPFPSLPLSIPAAKDDKDRGLAFRALLLSSASRLPQKLWAAGEFGESGARNISKCFWRMPQPQPKARRFRTPIAKQGPGAYLQGPGTRRFGGARAGGAGCVGVCTGDLNSGVHLRLHWARIPDPGGRAKLILGPWRGGGGVDSARTPLGDLEVKRVPQERPASLWRAVRVLDGRPVW